MVLQKENLKDDAVSVLLRVKKDWSPPEGLNVGYKTGSFVQGTASKEALKQLNQDKNVLNCELERSLGRFK